MRCLGCNKNLTDREASRKYLNWREIKDPEQRYILLCDPCIRLTDLPFEENPKTSDQEYQDDTLADESEENIDQ